MWPGYIAHRNSSGSHFTTVNGTKWEAINETDKSNQINKDAGELRAEN